MTILSLPKNSQFDSIRAMELAHLIERAYQQYDCHETKKEWTPEKSKRLNGSTQFVPVAKLTDRLPDFNLPAQVEYELLATFQYTAFWFAVPEDLPFGFIAQRVLEDGSPGIFVVFRGTRENSEWYNNFLFDQVPFMDKPQLGLVSRGFDKVYSRPSKGNGNQSISDKIRGTLAHCPVNSKVFVTGHSLGGALASLAALDIAKFTSFNNPTLYTFASPRVGDCAFAQHFKDLGLLAFRVANGEDLVPTVPPPTGQMVGEEMLMGMTAQQKNTVKSLREILGHFVHDLNQQVYEHVGEAIYFHDQRGTISLNHNMFATYRNALR